MANPLFQAACSSARFARRRWSSPEPKIETLIIDVDRTLTSENSPKFALEKMVGREEAGRIFDSFLNRVLRGKLKLKDIHLAVYTELYSRGFRQSDWSSIMEELERKGGLKTDLIGALQEISAREGTTMVLATRASRDGAEWLARRYGFHHAVGSVEMVNGTFQGFQTKIGSEDDGNGTVTKLTAAARAMADSGRVLDPSRTAVIANDLLDALEMLRCARGIVILPSEPNRLEKLTSLMMLYDVLLAEGSAPSTLRNALGFG